MQPIKSYHLGSTLLLIGLLLMSALCHSTATETATQEQLLPFYAKYKGYRYGMPIGEASILLEGIGRNEYKLSYKSKASLFFLTDRRSETSQFKLVQDGIVPYKYSYRRKGTGKDKKVDVLFDDQQQRIHIDEEDMYPWQGELDNQLFRLDIQRRLAKGESDFFYKLVNDRGQLREYRLKAIGTEQLDLPYGTLEGIKVEIIREAQSKRKTYVWFSPQLGYHLVRLQQFKDGDEQGDIRLSQFQIKS